MTKLLITILVLLSATNAFGQVSTDSIHPIDRQCDSCLAQNLVKTSDMMQCIANARDAWQKEMDHYYKLLLAKLEGEPKQSLIASQSAWSTYKDKEFGLSISIYYREDMGRERRIDAIGRQSELYKQRAMELRVYYDVLVSNN